MVSKKVENKNVEKKNANYKIGMQGEALACDYLIKNGFDILRRNYHANGGEIDIVAQKNNILSFVEVKMRKSATYGTAIESISEAKKKKIIKAAIHYTMKEDTRDIPMQFCVVAIQGINGKNKIELIENAFQVYMDDES